MTPDQAYFNSAAAPLGSLTLADAPLIDAEKLFRQPRPPHGSLVLGERVFINTGATVVANHSVVVGDDCSIGDLVPIFDSDHHPTEPSRPTRFAPVRLGVNVWDGRSATILPGVTEPGSFECA